MNIRVRPGEGQTLFQSFLGIFENIQSLIAVGTLGGKENMSLACIYYGCHGLAHSLYSPLWSLLQIFKRMQEGFLYHFCTGRESKAHFIQLAVD